MTAQLATIKLGRIAGVNAVTAEKNALATSVLILSGQINTAQSALEADDTVVAAQAVNDAFDAHAAEVTAYASASVKLTAITDAATAVSDGDLDTALALVISSSDDVDTAVAAGIAYGLEAAVIGNKVTRAGTRRSTSGGEKFYLLIDDISDKYDGRAAAEQTGGSDTTGALRAMHDAYAAYYGHMEAIVNVMLDNGVDPLNGVVPAFASTINLGARAHGMGGCKMQSSQNTLNFTGVVDVKVPSIKSKFSGAFEELGPDGGDYSVMNADITGLKAFVSGSAPVLGLIEADGTIDDTSTTGAYQRAEKGVTDALAAKNIADGAVTNAQTAQTAADAAQSTADANKTAFEATLS